MEIKQSSGYRAYHLAEAAAALVRRAEGGEHIYRRASEMQPGEEHRVNHSCKDGAVKMELVLNRCADYFTWLVKVRHNDTLVLNVLFSTDVATSELNIWAYEPGEWERELLD